MRFPSAEKLHLPCRLAQIIPGRMSADGRRVLPTMVLHPTAAAADPAGVQRLGVVDRHHVVDPAHVGAAGVARLVWLLSRLRVQSPPFQQRLGAEDDLTGEQISMVPTASGRVVAVLAWEEQKRHLPYEALYAELLLDVGLGVVGVRTSATAASLAESLGKARIEPGDWLAVSRSRIDILGFERTEHEDNAHEHVTP